MLRPLSNFNWREAILRMAVDFLVVHSSMVATLALAVVYQTAVGPAAAANVESRPVGRRCICNPSTRDVCVTAARWSRTCTSEESASPARAA